MLQVCGADAVAHEKPGTDPLNPTEEPTTWPSVYDGDSGGDGTSFGELWIMAWGGQNDQFEVGDTLKIFSIRLGTRFKDVVGANPATFIIIQ